MTGALRVFEHQNLVVRFLAGADLWISFATGDPETALRIEIDLNRLLYTRDPGLNIEIKPLDTISVTKADVVYVTGAVKLPGGFVLDDRPSVTVVQAVSMAGGFSTTAKRGGAKILRTQKDGSKVELPVDLGKVLKGKAEDVTLASNDILYIPDSTRKVASSRAIDASVSTLSAWLIWGHP